jgi:hypothetical protein
MATETGQDTLHLGETGDERAGMSRQARRWAVASMNTSSPRRTSPAASPANIR